MKEDSELYFEISESWIPLFAGSVTCDSRRVEFLVYVSKNGKLRGRGREDDCFFEIVESVLHSKLSLSRTVNFCLNLLVSALAEIGARDLCQES